MNKRQKRKRYKIQSTAKQRKYNRWLCKRYPFLIPRNVWTDKICWYGKKYSWTLADDFPDGWWKAFGELMSEELRDELIKFGYLRKYRVLQIKEKYGRLCFYDGGYPRDSDVSNIIGKYSKLSKNICIKCGKPDVPQLNYRGWFSPYCFDCFKKMELESWKYWQSKNYSYDKPTEEELATSYEEMIVTDLDDIPNPGRMADTRRYIEYSGGEKKEYSIDISETAEAIRERWVKRGGKNNE